MWAIVEESGGNITTRSTCSNKSNLLNIDSAVTTRSHCNAVRTFHCFTKSSKPCLQLQYNAVAVYTRPLFAKPRHTCLKLHNVQQVTLHRSHSYMFTTGRTTAYSCIYLKPQIVVRFNVTTWVGIKISSIIQIVGSNHMISFCTVHFSRNAKSLGRVRRKLT